MFPYFVSQIFEKHNEKNGIKSTVFVPWGKWDEASILATNTKMKTFHPVAQIQHLHCVLPGIRLEANKVDNFLSNTGCVSFGLKFLLATELEC